MYFVSRQIRWPDGSHLVEICEGQDYASPGMLVPRWSRLGEGQEFKDPREAVSAAVAVCEAWRKVADPDDPVPELAGFATAGGMCATEEVTYDEARAWAERTWERLPKCSHCGDPLPEKGKRWRAETWSGEEQCSESCAEAVVEFNERWEAEQAAEEEACDG